MHASFYHPKHVISVQRHYYRKARSKTDLTIW